MLSNQLIEKFNEAFAQHSLSTMKQIFLSSNLLQEEKAKLLKDCASDNNAIQTTGSSSSNFCQYRLACQQGDVEMVGFYLNMAAATSSNALLTEMIELAECDGPYWPFRICCTNGHTDVIKLIWSVATPIQQLGKNIHHSHTL